MPDDQVTIDPEFRPPPPAEGQAHRLRAAGVVGVVVAAFAFGWFLRSPTPTDAEPDEVSHQRTNHVDSADRWHVDDDSTINNDNHQRTVRDDRLGASLSEVVPAFTDVITLEQWTETGVDVIRWRASQPAPETIESFGADGTAWFAGLDASSTWYALQDELGVLSVHRLGGADAVLGWFPDLQAVGVRVTSPAWHDTQPGQLAWLSCSRTPGGRGTLYRLDVTDGMAEPVPVRLVDKACSDNAGAWLQKWGDWGFVVGVSEGETFEIVLLAADGSEVTSARDESTDPWILAGHPVGTIWTENALGSDWSSFLLSPDGQSRAPVPGLAEGEWLDDARWSPDGTRLALALRTTVEDASLVRVVDLPTAATIGEIPEIADSEGHITLGHGRPTVGSLCTTAGCAPTDADSDRRNGTSCSTTP